MGWRCAPIEGIGHDEVLPKHEEDGGQDGGDDGAANRFALAVPLAVQNVGCASVAADGHRCLSHRPCIAPSIPYQATQVKPMPATSRAHRGARCADSEAHRDSAKKEVSGRHY